MFAFDSSAPPSAFARCLRHDSTVRQTLAEGGSLEDMVVALCAEKAQLSARVAQLEAMGAEFSEAPAARAFRGSPEHLLPA